MTAADINILSIVPYPFLPVINGGQQAITKLHHYLGLHCNNHIISTDNNTDNPFSFKLHNVFPDKGFRHIPGYGVKDILKVAREINCTHIICEHPFMAYSAMLAARKLGVPWYLRSHNIESQRYKELGNMLWPIIAWFERYAMQQADGIFFITPEDADWAVKHFNISPDKCHIVLFGCDQQAISKGHIEAKRKLADELNISANVPWLYFLGALDYRPNQQAVRYIVDEIQPRLKKSGIPHEILIAGKGLSESLQQQITYTNNIHSMGFVEDLELFINACDIMLNPVLGGGGIKTKAVEALSYNKTVISSVSGAAGLITAVCGDKLVLAADNNWDEFTGKLVTAIDVHSDIPDSFYDTYHHAAIANKVIDIILGNAS